MKTTSYDKEHDIFFIHKGFSNDEKFKGNIDAGDLVMDVSTKGRIRGIEIINASKFLKDFDVGNLESVTDAQFNTTIKPNGIMLGIVFKAKNTTHSAKIAVPVQIPN